MTGKPQAVIVFTAASAVDAANGNAGRALNLISGQARRSGEAPGQDLEHHVYDVFWPRAKAAGHDMPSRHRQEWLAAFFAANAGAPHPFVVPVENFPVRSQAEIDGLTRRFLAAGLEGAIVRRDARGYEFGYKNRHSSGVLKFKPVLSEEAEIVGFTQGSAGKDVGALIWRCRARAPVPPSDGLFDTVPNMPYPLRRALFRCLGAPVRDARGREVSRFERDVKGLMLTIEHRGLSAKTGIPLQARGVIVRSYEQGAERDPFARVLADCGAAAPLLRILRRSRGGGVGPSGEGAAGPSEEDAAE